MAKPFDLEQTEKLIKRNLNSYKENGFGRYVVELKSTGEIIGDVGFLYTEINNKLENDLGYIIYSKFWGNGYGYEAAKACLDYGFINLSMERIVANMAYNHKKSIKIAEKLGMLKEKEFINQKNRNILTYIYKIEK